MTFKMPIGIFPYQLNFDKACHLQIKLEHKALWSLKRLNMNWKKVSDSILEQLNEMDEFHLCTYERADLYKERMKK